MKENGAGRRRVTTQSRLVVGEVGCDELTVIGVLLDETFGAEFDVEFAGVAGGQARAAG